MCIYFRHILELKSLLVCIYFILQIEIIWNKNRDPLINGKYLNCGNGLLSKAASSCDVNLDFAQYKTLKYTAL